MEKYIEELKRRLGENPRETGDSLVEGIYRHYLEDHVIDSNKLRLCFRKIDEYTGKLPFDAQDDICSTIVAMCAELERVSFLAGLRLGAQIILELERK